MWCALPPRRSITLDILKSKLKKEGTLQARPVAVSSASTPYQRVFLESGLRAIIECAPYRLPPGFFAEWQAFIPVFDNRDL